MKKFLKILSFVLALTMLVSVVAACGNSSKTDPSSDSSSSGSSSSQSAAPKDAPTLKWFVIGGQPKDLDKVTDKMNEYSADKISVKCKFTYLDWGVYADRVKAILNSGEYFDILFNNQDYFSSAVSLGAFADITDLLAETPELKSFVPEGVWKGVTIKDKIYGVPTYKDSSQTQYWVWDKELVEKYNIDYKNIKTIAQMEPALRAIQDGIKKGEIKNGKYAFFMKNEGVNGMFYEYDSIISRFALGVHYKDKDGKVVRILEQPEIVDDLNLLHKWYKDGLINPDAATLKESPKWNPVGAGQGWPGAEATWGNNAGKPVVAQNWSDPIYSTTSIQGSINSIGNSSKYKKEALKYLELCNIDPEMRNMLRYGIEGVHFKKNDNGTVTLDPVKKDDYSTPAYSQATFFTMWPTDDSPPDLWTKVKEWNNKAVNSVLLGFSFDRENVKNEIAACDKVYDKYAAELITGSVEPTERIKKIYDEMDKAGLGKIQEELQNQVNKFLGK